MRDETKRAIGRIREAAIRYWGEEALMQSILHSSIRSDDLAEFILERRPRRILEIGTLRGLSAALMATVAGCDVITVALNGDAHTRSVLDFWGSLGLGGRITIAAVKDNVDKIMWSMIPGLEWFFDMALIDGDHSYAEVCLDFAICRQLINEGTVVLDDIRNKGVAEFIGQITRHYTVEIREGLLAVNIPPTLEGVQCDSSSQA